jgi:Amt family ammonium transporter
MNQDATMFLIICSALVLFMTPGLAFFYGGLVRASSVVSMMMMSFGSLGLIGVLWIGYGYAISFANGTDPGFIGIDSIIGISPGKLFMTHCLRRRMATVFRLPSAVFREHLRSSLWH